MVRAILVVAGAAVLVAVGTLWVAGAGPVEPALHQPAVSSPVRPPAHATAPDAPGRPTPGRTVVRPRTTEGAAPAAPPRRIRIPSLGVDASVDSMGLDHAGALEVPTEPDLVGWWGGGSPPGATGPAVLVGHRDSVDGPAVFYDLSRIEVGALVEVVDADGRTHRFRVERAEQHPRDDFPTQEVYGPTDAPTLRLLTCGGDYDPDDGYEDNIVVFADQVG